MEDIKTMTVDELFNLIVSVAEKRKADYLKDPLDKSLLISLSEDNEEFGVTLKVEEKKGIIIVCGLITAIFPRSGSLDAAIACCLVNNLLIDGCCEFCLNDGSVNYRTSMPYIDAEINEKTIGSLIDMATNVLNDFNDRFVKLADGEMDLREFKSLLDKK